MFQRAGMKEGGLPLPPAFQYLILMTWRACDLNFVMISSLASKCLEFKVRGLQFHFIKQLKNRHPKFKALPFWSQWRYQTKSKLQAFHVIRIKYWKACGSRTPPLLIPALWNNDIFLESTIVRYGMYPQLGTVGPNRKIVRKIVLKIMSGGPKSIVNYWVQVLFEYIQSQLQNQSHNNVNVIYEAGNIIFYCYV